MESVFETNATFLPHPDPPLCVEQSGESPDSAEHASIGNFVPAMSSVQITPALWQHSGPDHAGSSAHLTRGLQSAGPFSQTNSLQQERALFIERLQSISMQSARPQQQSALAPAIEVIFSGPSDHRRDRANKRKEQNKKSQQAYRARKEQYRQTLSRDISDADQKLALLREENCGLLRRLCDVHASNNELRRLYAAAGININGASKRSNGISTSRRIECIAMPADSTITQAAPSSKGQLSPEAIETLRDPFQALQNVVSSLLGYEATDRDLSAAMEGLQAANQRSEAIQRVNSVTGHPVEDGNTGKTLRRTPSS